MNAPSTEDVFNLIQRCQNVEKITTRIRYRYFYRAIELEII